MTLLLKNNTFFIAVFICITCVYGKLMQVDDSRELDQFKKSNTLKLSSNVTLQTIENTISWHGVEYSLEGLEPYSILSNDFDNSTQLGPSPLWRKVVNDTVILVIMDGNIISHVSIRNRQDRGEIMHVPANETSDEPKYAAIANTDYDHTELFKMSKNGRSYSDWMKDNDKEKIEVSSKVVAHARSPKSEDCSASQTTSVIEVAVAHDASFCKEFKGDKQRVNSHIQAIVAMAAEYYEPACISLRLSHIDGTCNSSNDPYKSIAKSKQILEEFTAEWRDNRENVRRDVAHLFSGTSFDRGILGWAWKNTVCSKANGYGANWLTFSENIALRASLFAHELGHNAGANHFGGSCSEWLMAPCGSGLSGFSEDSLDSVTLFLNKQTCLDKRPTEFGSIATRPPPNGPQLNNPNRPNRPSFPKPRPTPILSPTINNHPFPAPILSPPSAINNNNMPTFVNPQPSPIFTPTINRPSFQPPINSPPSLVSNNNGPPFLNPQPGTIFSPTTNNSPFLAPIFAPPTIITNNNNGPPFLNSPLNPILSPPTSQGNPSTLGVRNPDKYFAIRNVAVESFCLGLESNRVTMEACNGSQMQKWGFDAKSRTIQSLSRSNKCMVPDVGNRITKRTRLIVKDCPGNIEEIQLQPSLQTFQWGFSGGKILNKGTTSAIYIEASRGIRRNGNVEEVVLVPTLSLLNGKDYQKWTRSFE